MNASIVAEQEIRVGRPVVVEAPAPEGLFSVVFEDDGDTGYFYALELARGTNPVVDAVHIYNVANVSDREIPSQVQIVWAGDGEKALLLINGYPHAIFDFASRRGYCRTGFPPPATVGWRDHSHAWSEEALGLFL